MIYCKKCIDCSKRKVGCHSHCQAFRLFRVIKDAENKKKKKAMDEEKFFNSVGAVIWKINNARTKY